MLNADEIRRSLVGSWALLRGRPDGMNAFDLSVDGFWRSFQVFFLLLPPFVVSLLAERRLILSEIPVPSDEFPDGRFAVAQLFGFAIDWVMLPLLLAVLARPLAISHGYAAFIVARNWTSLIAVIPFTLPALLYLLDIVTAPVMIVLTLAAMAIVMHYRYQVARIALKAPVGLAIGVVVLDLLLSLLIGEVISRISGL